MGEQQEQPIDLDHGDVYTAARFDPGIGHADLSVLREQLYPQPKKGTAVEAVRAAHPPAHGEVGTIQWVREHTAIAGETIRYGGDLVFPPSGKGWKPPIAMPRKLARMFLRVTSANLIRGPFPGAGNRTPRWYWETKIEVFRDRRAKLCAPGPEAVWRGRFHARLNGYENPETVVRAVLTELIEMRDWTELRAHALTLAATWHRSPCAGHAVTEAAMQLVKAHRERIPDAWEALVEKERVDEQIAAAPESRKGNRPPSPIAPEPPPAVTGSTPVWPLVIADVERLGFEDPVRGLLLADMRARDAFGRAKYGTPLTSDNGRDHLRDAYQEVLDECVYLRAEIERGDPTGMARELYVEAIRHAARLRTAIVEDADPLAEMKETLAALGHDPDAMIERLKDPGFREAFNGQLGRLEARHAAAVAKADPLAGLPGEERNRIIAVAHEASRLACAGLPYGSRAAPSDAAYEATIAREVAALRSPQPDPRNGDGGPSVTQAKPCATILSAELDVRRDPHPFRLSGAVPRATLKVEIGFAGGDDTTADATTIGRTLWAWATEQRLCSRDDIAEAFKLKAP